MNHARRLLFAFVAVLGASPTNATEYAIRFDLGMDHPSSSSGPAMKPGQLSGWFRFRSVGWAKGGLFKNSTNKELKAIWIKVTHPRTASNPTGDLLAITSELEDDLFDTIYVKDDHTEVIFSCAHGKIAKNEVIWNKITQSTQDEINHCQNNGEDVCPLAGQLFETPQMPPEGEHWTKIKGAADKSAWKPLASLPLAFRQVDVYGVSDDERYAIFVSRDRVMAYDSTVGRAFFIDDPARQPEGINRIAFKNGEFIVYRSGVAGSTFKPGEWRVTEFDEASQ